MAEKFLAFKERKKLALPYEIIGGGEFDGHHVNHGVEREKVGEVFLIAIEARGIDGG